MQQVIQLQAGDDLPAIGHLLEAAQARRVVLVLPRGYTLLRDRLSVRLVARHAAGLALEVALLTRDGQTRRVARDEGLGTVSTLRQGQHGRWSLPVPRRSAAQHAAVARMAAMRDGRSEAGLAEVVILWAGRLLGLLGFLFLLGMIVGLAALVVPEARIIVTPYRESVNVVLELRAEPEASKPNLETLTIPARLIQAEVEEVGETATVAARDAPADPATGTVVFINQQAAAREILPGAIVRTSTGTTVRFKTVTTATLEAQIGATSEVQVEALEPGPVGNVPAATINTVETSELRGEVRVINEQPTSGGSVKQVGVVSRADMDRLNGQLLQQLQQKAYEELQKQLLEHEFLPPESMTVEILSEVYDQFLDAPADVLHLTMRVFAVGTAVDTANANLLTFQAIRERVPATYELESEQITFALGRTVQMDGRDVLVTASASVPLVSDIQPGQVRRIAAGLPADEAARALAESVSLDAPPEITIGPEWIKRWKWLDRVPYLPFRIQVVVLD